MLKKVYIYLLLQALLVATGSVFAQTFPVTVSTNITPPYSTYLGDYVAPGSQKLALNIFVNDLNRPELQTRLRLRIEGQGILIETKPEFLPQPLLLQGGVPERLIASDLAPYFSAQNLNFNGITRQQFERTGQLPEGLYSICFEVLEYNRGAKVSNSGCTMAWLILNDPPMINLPRQNEKLRPQQPQYVTFQWTPRHTGSPNSAFSTEYEFTLVELWPENRNPNDAILTSPPIYQTTTQSTTLIYGPAQTPLEPGRRYAFQVKAKSITGVNELDLFKNQGRSVVHSFQYGDACEIPANIRASASSSGAFKITYESNFNNTAFSVRYRKANDPKARWFEEDSYLEALEINGLQAETTYEYQVTAGCGPFNSEYSAVAQVTTDAMPEVTYACGLPPEDFDFGNNEPLPALQKDDILYAGDFNVKISEATGSAGTFTGKGTVVVPYLDNLAVSVEFASISVNTDYRMTAGSMDVKGVGVDVLPDDFTDFLDKLDETIASVDEVLDDVSDGLDVADEILDEVGDLANDILDNGPFTDEEEEEMEDFTVEQYEEAAEEAVGAAASALSGGATKQNISDAARQLAKATALKNRANKLQNIHNNSDTLNIRAVEFHENLSQFNGNKMGFDAKEHKAHRLHYNIMVLPDGNVAVPWVATKAGEAGTVKAKFLPNDSVTTADISFKSGSDGSTLSASLSGNDWTITLPSIATEESIVINAVDKKGQTVGKLNAIGCQELKRKVHIVPVGNSSASFSKEQLTGYLNRIYAQAGASWEVDIEDAITVEGYDGILQDDKQALFSTYSEGMKEIINAYKNDINVSIVNNEFYLFLVDQSQTGKSGYMPRKHQYGFIYMGESGDKLSTIAHELGHGAFRLQHVHEEYPTISESTDNLMDSIGTGTNLRKYQWDLIHNPPVVVGLVEDLEEGSLATAKWFTPDWKVFKVKESKTIYGSTIEQVPQGTIPGFTENGVQYKATFEGETFKGYFSENGLAPTSVVYFPDSKPSDAVYLFENWGGCDQNKYYKTTKEYALDNRTETTFFSALGEGKIIKCKPDINISELYYTEGIIETDDDLTCEDLLAEFRKSELSKSDVLRTAIENDPCILKTLRPIDEGLGYRTEWMNELDRVIAGFSFTFIGIAGTTILLPQLVEMAAYIVEYYGAEASRKFMEGVLFEAYTYQLVNEYFNDGKEIDPLDFSTDVLIAGIRNVVKYEKTPQAVAACIQGMDLSKINEIIQKGDISIKDFAQLTSECGIAFILERLFGSSASNELATQIKRSGSNKLARVLQKLDMPSLQQFDVMVYLYNLDNIVNNRGRFWKEKMVELLPTENGSKAFDVLREANFDLGRLSWRNFERLKDIVARNGTTGLKELFEGTKDVNRMLVYLDKTSSSYQEYIIAMNKIKSEDLFEGTVTINGKPMNTLGFFENEVKGSTYYSLDNDETISLVKAFEQSDIAIEMIVDRTTNTIISVDQGAFGTMTTGYIKELVSDDQE
ncbi:hypothetical protein SAMN05661096_00221 [Marivirga sericea]|uniref:Fibronectin type-III domain-containing protein n=1 Tax=Marivirga sericea TaxID=1028 RepID=A0A1X7I639_9BACT|nr:fibronectin type III domain-containing protein [Marivirga sericea]SMG09495.1 hypothetical protein SAMN05661096_00221 [Marivirga sericea]